MKYTQPILSIVRPFYLCKNQQTGEFETCPDMTFIRTPDCECVCPDIALCADDLDGTDVEVEITMTLEAGDCNATFENVNPIDYFTNDIIDGVLYLGCQESNYTCVDFDTCTEGEKGQTGRVCITSLSVNGVEQDGFPICEDGVDSYFVDLAIQFCIDQP